MFCATAIVAALADFYTVLSLVQLFFFDSRISLTSPLSMFVWLLCLLTVSASLRTFRILDPPVYHSNFPKSVLTT